MTRHYAPAEIVEGFTALFPLPSVYLRVKSVVEDPQSQTQDLVRELGNDPALTARVLRLVNSPIYRRGSHVDALAPAVSLLGTRAIHELVLASAATTLCTKADLGKYDLHGHWRESIRTATLARALGVHHKMMERERLFVEGLLSRVGLLVMHERIGPVAAMVARHAASKGLPLQSVQRQFIGCHYGEVGAALLRSWQLPESLCEALAQHLDAPCPDESMDVSVLRLAAVLAPDLDEPPGDEELRQRLAMAGDSQLELDLEEAQDVLEQARGEYLEMERALMGSGPAAA